LYEADKKLFIGMAASGHCIHHLLLITPIQSYTCDIAILTECFCSTSVSLWFF